MSELKTRPVSKSRKTVFTLKDARTILDAALGDNSKKYFKHVREWFKLRTTKKVIDSVARRYLKHEGLLCYHEIFIQTLLIKASGLEEASLDEALERVFPGGRVCPRLSKAYRPASPVQPSRKQDADLNMGEVAVEEYSCLPTPELVHGRFILTILDHGLVAGEPVVVDVVVEATRTFLKNVLTAIVDDVAPFKRCSWSHIYHIEPSASRKCKQVLYKQEEAYDKETLLNVTLRGNALLGLIPKKPDREPGGSSGSADVAMPSKGPQPAETSIRLTSSIVFNALKRSPRIIPIHSILSHAVTRASMNLR